MMKYFGEDELTQIMGVGMVGEIRRGPDGNLYQWVHGVDGLGNLYGFWDKVKKVAKSVAKPVVDVAQKAVQFVKKPYCIPLQAIPGPIKGITKKVCKVVGHLRPLANIPVVGSYYQGINRFCNVAKECGISGLEGGLMQAPDGTLYQVQGLDGGEADTIGATGSVGMGALFQAPDGTVYQMSNFSDEELQGFEADDDFGDLTDDDLRGLEADDELDGLDDEDELGDFADDNEFHGFAADEDLASLAEDEMGYLADEDLQGCQCQEQNLSDDLYGYIPDSRLQGMDAYIPAGLSAAQAPRTFKQTPEPWKSLW